LLNKNTERVTVKIRYLAPKVNATAYPLNCNKLKINLENAQRAITPGQAVVLYRGEQVVGGGTISSPK
jgi:tRNA-specific 2-thiouridylase